MAGNANSGRRPGALTNAQTRLRNDTIEKCWKLIADNLDNQDLDLKFRLELAAKHSVKSMPTELTGDVSAHVVAMGTITKKGAGSEETLHFNIGSPIESNPENVSDSPEDT